MEHKNQANCRGWKKLVNYVLSLFFSSWYFLQCVYVYGREGGNKQICSNAEPCWKSTSLKWPIWWPWEMDENKILRCVTFFRHSNLFFPCTLIDTRRIQNEYGTSDVSVNRFCCYTIAHDCNDNVIATSLLSFVSFSCIYLSVYMYANANFHVFWWIFQALMLLAAQRNPVDSTTRNMVY